MLTALLLTIATVASPIPLDKAERVFAEARLAAEEDGGRLWGRTLAGPIIVVDPKTRFAVANQRDAEGVLTPSGAVFTGTLPTSVVIANTGTTWSGTRWTMVLWSALGDRAVSKRRLLMHESWHRIQDELGFKQADHSMPELDTVDGRYWFQLELRALEAALRGSGDERKKAIADALVFRAARRRLEPTLAARERSLETNEGLAEYTGWALRGTTDAESRLAFSARLARLDRNESFARGMAYYTGPAYGLLLDAAAPGWTRAFRASDDMGEVLAKSLQIDAAAVGGAPLRYRGAELRADEERRDTERRQTTARYRALFIDGPTLELPMANAKFGFDPNFVIPLGDAGSVYPTLEVTADWGVLSVKEGALITSDFSRFIVARPDGNRGPGWTLTLQDGWEIRPGVRSGSYTVSPRR